MIDFGELFDRNKRIRYFNQFLSSPMSQKITQIQEFNNFVLFTTNTGKINIHVLFHNETLRLTQKKMAELFEIDRSVISKHIKNIIRTKELDENSVSANFAHTAEDAKKYQTKHYNLQAIIAVGYRVNSHKATEFRKRATSILHEHIIKGFTLDDKRLKQIQHFGKDYFDELIEKIREIRASERRFYQKVTDIYMLYLLIMIPKHL